MMNDNPVKDECYLSDHTIAMRRALAFCIDQIKHQPTQPSIQGNKNSIPRNRNEYNIVCVSSIDILSQMPSPSQFRQEYVRTNRPCVIRDPVWAQQYFGRVLQAWGGSSEQRRQWFTFRYKNEDRVPVKVTPSIIDEVDDHGRALECETQYDTLIEWYNKLDISLTESYLKDWHFQKYFEINCPNEPPLYHTPPHFECDLLNQMQLQFTKGDYRFTYWGPDGSQTGLHTDVLNSFSWSFNIVGVKEWTFYTPSPVKLLQHPGECVFVPAKLPHTVRNRGETLSVNHNWITSANLDLVWQCIKEEIKSVETEIKEWEKASLDLAYDWDAKELMLRGCVGLDITAFFFMILIGLVKILPDGLPKGYEVSDRSFDLLCLSNMLVDLVTDQSLHLTERLEACLADTQLAAAALDTAGKALGCIGHNNNIHRKEYIFAT